MSDPAVRVALLGRAGKARDQLHRALSESGAAIVVEGDPAELDPATVAGLAPTCYLVSLEPAIERSLERFDDLLAAPGVEVMFDDAETSARLDGWDLNRWARHIAAKLLGHDGLPPVPESQRADDTALSAPAAAASSGMDDATDPDEGISFSDAIDLDDGIDFNAGIDLGADNSLGKDDSLGNGISLGNDLDLGGDVDFDLELPVSSVASGDEDDLSDSIDFSASGDDAVEGGALDLDIAELSAQLEAYETSGRRLPSADTLSGVGERDIESIDAVAVQESPAAAARPGFDFSNLALAPADEGMVAPVAIAIAPEPTTELRLAPISGHDGLGAVVILAGLGGPDAVRQLLASLPEDLPAPVLLYQHLEVGKHERLVDQLAKVSKLPVALAQLDASPRAGQVTLLPAGMTAVARDDQLVFVPGELSSLLLSLPPRESMVVVLSGADAALVPTILEVRDAGGLVFAQDPDVCFDAGASEALQAEGATVLPALGLARRIADRWSH